MISVTLNLDLRAIAEQTLAARELGITFEDKIHGDLELVDFNDILAEVGQSLDIIIPDHVLELSAETSSLSIGELKELVEHLKKLYPRPWEEQGITKEEYNNQEQVNQWLENLNETGNNGI